MLEEWCCHDIDGQAQPCGDGLVWEGGAARGGVDLEVLMSWNACSWLGNGETVF